MECNLFQKNNMTSPREQIQIDLMEYLSNRGVFNAPYGILDGMETLSKGGKVRTVTFGQARYLDATVYIFSPTNITIRAQGSASYRLNSKYNSYQSLIDDLDKFK